MFKVGDKVKVLIGKHINKHGTVNEVADPDLPYVLYPICVKIFNCYPVVLRWFHVKEIEKA